MPTQLTVLGLGYLGVAHAVCLAELGFEVLGVDTDADRIRSLSAGEVPFFEPGVEELLLKGLGSGKLRFTTSYLDAAAFGNVHFVCVGTPQSAESGRADISQVENCIAALAPFLRSPSVVVGKSTVPVGTAAALTESLVRLAPCGTAGRLAWKPGVSA